MADTLAFLQNNKIETLDDLDKLHSISKNHVSDTHKAVMSTEARLHKIDKMYHARLTILKNRDIYKQYLNAPNKKAFREKNSADIMLYEVARKELQVRA